MERWEKERRAFHRTLPTLSPAYDGLFVAVRGGRVVGADGDHDRLFHRVEQRYRAGTFFIGGVGVEDRVADMPGFEVV